jgi:hypothetical protein
MENTRNYLKKLGLPGGDLYDLPTSKLTFPDGAQYRIEVPTVNTPQAMKALLETAKDAGIIINRVDETYGIMRFTDKQISEFVDLAKQYKCELTMSVGPRATYDTSATMLTPQGARIGYRLRGVEQLVRAIEDVKRAVEMGVRGILVYDEGLLWVLGNMRKDGELPSDLHLKISAHCGHGNPAAAKVMENLGADTFNPVRDLQLPMMAALRAVIKIPLDLHTDNPPGSGGFIRTYEAPEIARIAAPVHLKCGNSAVAGHGEMTGEKEGIRMAWQAELVVKMVKKYYPQAKQSEPGAKGLAIPK